MGIQQLRDKLISDIQIAGEAELKSILKIHQIAKQQKEETTIWATISEAGKTKINKGLQQLKNGEGKPAAKVVSRLNKKYGIA